MKIIDCDIKFDILLNSMDEWRDEFLFINIIIIVI